MAEVAIDGLFDHAFLVFNTLFNLQTQEEQVKCFVNLAKRLKKDGCFLVEAFVPETTGFQGNSKVTARNLE